MEKTEKRYMTIRPFVKEYKILSERTIRKMLDEGKVPGIQTAKGFKINVELFLTQLDAISRDNAAWYTDLRGDAS